MSRVHATLARGRPGRPSEPTFRVPRLLLQSKLRIGAPGDRHERQADRVADRVMRMPEPALQRVCTGCEEDELQANTIQRLTTVEAVGQRARDEEELAQPKRIGAGGEAAATLSAGGFEAFRGGGRPLPSAAREFFEPRFGTSFEGVRVHTGGPAEAAAARIGARAFALGSSVVFGRGEYNPDSRSGRTLLAHELTHVVQQAGGRERIQRQVQIDPFAASTAPTAGFNADMTAAFFAGMQPGGLSVLAGLTRFSLNGTLYSSADTIGQDLALPLLSERDLRTIPQPNLRDPKLDGVWNDTALVKKGQEAKAVRLVQEALQAWGRGKAVPEDPLPKYGADAIFGDETLAAVHKFQNEWTGAGAPLVVDGLVGPLTLGALEAAMADLNVSEFWLNTAPHNQITGMIRHILPPASWSTLQVMRSTLTARALAAGLHVRSFARCRRRDKVVDFTAQGPANLDQQVLTHEQVHERDIGRAVRNHILPWHLAVSGLVASGQRFRAADVAAAEALIYAEIGLATAPTGGDPCSVGQALETDLVDFEFALHQLPGGSLLFTGFTTNTRRCTRAQANLNNQGTRPRQAPALGCNPPPHMTVSVQVPA